MGSHLTNKNLSCRVPCVRGLIFVAVIDKMHVLQHCNSEEEEDELSHDADIY